MRVDAILRFTLTRVVPWSEIRFSSNHIGRRVTEPQFEDQLALVFVDGGHHSSDGNRRRRDDRVVERPGAHSQNKGLGDNRESAA